MPMSKIHHVNRRSTGIAAVAQQTGARGQSRSMLNDLPPDLRWLAGRQAGVVSRSQTLAAGFSDRALSWRLQRASWQRLHTGVYAVFSGQLSREAVLWAAVLHAGPGAMLSYYSAAELAGLINSPAPAIHVTVPSAKHVQAVPGIVVHRSARAAAALHPAALPPRTRVEETVLDLADTARTSDDAYGWVARALGQRLTTTAKLAQALEQRERVRWRADLAAAVSADCAGLLSVLEYRYVRDVERPHGFPQAKRQAMVRQGGRTQYRDSLYEEYSVIVELDGRAAHPAEGRWRDIRRDNVAAAGGQVTLRYGWLDITAHPCEVAAQADAVFRRRGYAGCRPCSAGCPVGRGR